LCGPVGGFVGFDGPSGGICGFCGPSGMEFCCALSVIIPPNETMKSRPKDWPPSV